MSFRQQGQASHHSASPYYASASRDIGDVHYGVTSDASILGQLPFQGLDLPLEYEPYPGLRQVNYEHNSGSLHHQQHHQNLQSYLNTPNHIYSDTTPSTSSAGPRKGKEPVIQSPPISSPKGNDPSLEKKTHRRIQNRLSQRAYRTRKDRLIESLEHELQNQIRNRKQMAEICNKKIDSCIEILHTQVQELSALKAILMRDVDLEEGGRQKEEREENSAEREGERESSMEGVSAAGFEFDANAWGYQF
ncbi:hypothetical protein EG329_008652 [Mollisiaceae sp. DMI_Dod_QoI]|nr:hypothetical protein EG329_008652 [Helotiales sp. DMI_Dod_QoI]